MADLARLGIVVDSSQVTTANQRLGQMRRTGARTESRLKRFGQTSTRVGRRLATGLTAPLVAMGVASTKVASDFEESMTRINTLVGLSEDTVAGMREEVLQLAGDTAVAPRELSEALFTVTSAGARGSEAMEILERSAKASAIGLGETRQIARSTTAILQAYGKETISASEATDILTGTVREGNLEASDLAPVLGRVIGIASQLGISFQEVGANIATFTRLGVGAEEAVTGLRGVMNALLKPTSEGAKQLQEVGISFEELRSKVADEGLAKTMIDLVQSFEGNEEALSEVIPNVRALSNVLGTAGAQSEAYDQILKNLNDTLGIVDEGFATVSETASFRFQKTLAVLEKTAIEVGSAFLPMAIKISDAVTDILESFNNLSEAGKETAFLIAGLLGAGGPVLLALGALSTAIASITAPIAGIAVAVGATATLIINNWSEIEEYFTTGGGSEFWSETQRLAGRALDVIQQAVSLFVDVTLALWENYGDTIMEKVGVAFSTIRDLIDFYLDRIEVSIKTWRAIAEGEFGKALDIIEEDFKTTWESILRSTLDYFGEGGMISDPFFAWFSETFVTRPLEALGIMEREVGETMDRVSGEIQPPKDIIIPADLPTAEELLNGVDFDLGEPIKIPATFDFESVVDLENVPEARRIIEPFELLDQAMLGLPVSIEQVDQALEQLDASLISTMSQAERDSIRELIEDLEDLRNELAGSKEDAEDTAEGLKQMDQVSSKLQFTFESAFESAIIGGESFKDVVNSLIDDLLRLTLRFTAIIPLAKTFSSFLTSTFGIESGGGGTTGSARGNVFGGGQLIDSRETTSFANGGTGLFGEGASLEGVFPLTRLPNGDLGIKTEGGGGGSNVNVTVINNADGTEAEVEETKRPDGGRDITVMVDEIVASKIRGGGKTAKALRDTFGTQRKPRLRG